MFGIWKAYTFGKEIAALQCHRGDIGVILSVAPISILLRGHAKWTIRYFLYGTLPTDSEQQELDRIVAKAGSDARASLSIIPKYNTGRPVNVVDAPHDDGKRFAAHADEKLTAFLELEAVIRAANGKRYTSHRV